jgi:hypothetical protein
VSPLPSPAPSRAVLVARVHVLQDVLQALEEASVRTGRPFVFATSATYDALQGALAELRQYEREQDARTVAHLRVIAGCDCGEFGGSDKTCPIHGYEGSDPDVRARVHERDGGRADSSRADGRRTHGDAA